MHFEITDNNFVTTDVKLNLMSELRGFFYLPYLRKCAKNVRKPFFVSLQQVKSLNGLTELVCWACRLVCNVSDIFQVLL